jgi:hypothetical protein
MWRDNISLVHQGYFQTQSIPSLIITWIASIEAPTNGRIELPDASLCQALQPKDISSKFPVTTSQRQPITNHCDQIASVRM